MGKRIVAPTAKSAGMARPSVHPTRAFNAFGGRSGGRQDADFDDRLARPQSAVRRGGHGRGGGGLPHHYGAAHPPPPPPQMPSIEQALSRVHDAIYEPVWEAVQQIMELETERTDADLAKRIVKYMYRSACDEQLVTLEWDQLCAQLVKGMFNGYSSACGESEWFFTIDLAEALTAAAMVLLPVTGWQVPPQQVYDVVSRAYQGQLDHITLEKALWEMAESLFGHDEKVKSKVYNAISRAYEPALANAVADLTPMEDITRVETFMRSWIDDSTCRAWGGLHESAEEVLNQENLVQMFDHLLQPFGDEHPFSAIPSVLTEHIGSPPPGWDFIPQVVEDLFASWENDASKPARKRRKKAVAEDASFDEMMAAADPDEDDAEDTAQVAPASTKKQKKKSLQEHPKHFPAVKKVKAEFSGHPSCTSGEDCAGSAEDGLVQHVLEDGPGDMYCEVCWQSFQQRNPDLEGVPVDA